MKSLSGLVMGLLLLLSAGAFAADETTPRKPNIIYILCDDLGYGDVKCLNPDCKIATPHVDALAKSGMTFTDAHSGSAVCTPTRYGVMTGRYAWRTKLQRGVLGGLSPSLIDPARMTVASLLKKEGYRTACVGKWHLGLDWIKQPGKQVNELNIESAQQVNNVDYSKPFGGGPLGAGFDEYFGISASLDMVPYTFLKNDRVAVLPTAEKTFPMMLGLLGGQTRKGPAAPDFEAADVLPALTKEAIAFINRQAPDAHAGKPFFLYLPLASPHTPIVPTSEWQGKSGLNPYADFVMQTDDAVGQLMRTLDEQKLAENTLVIFTSDNGCSPQANFGELKEKGHNPSYVFRGTKADIFEGGHRVPFIVRWPAQVPAGKTSDQLTCLTDFFATAAAVAGADVPANAAEDSVNMLPAITGKAHEPIREAVVHHSINGSFAIRRGNYKLEFCPGSGGWSEPKPGTKLAKELPEVQLYDLESDIGEQKNLHDAEPNVVRELTRLLNRYFTIGRSTPGVPQKNDVEIPLVGNP
ncbi:Arylsulfatase [Anatilimnocola aggregata]|uniref:Arylsulfatase n=1 Tax=Anatilimnocola aggregata TaxID=2528021 RepID=A0A517Y4I1_9BACT|nr:arylsulfatase [Anatilimnocola aggregata]QDU25106.1 Arylsulfatase [Anatilimnocola aggregata]